MIAGQLRLYMFCPEMKARMLAAVEGRRLRPVTEHMPKPMLEIVGCPILEHNVRLLAYHEIKQ